MKEIEISECVRYAGECAHCGEFIELTEDPEKGSTITCEACGADMVVK